MSPPLPRGSQRPLDGRASHLPLPAPGDEARDQGDQPVACRSVRVETALGPECAPGKERGARTQLPPTSARAVVVSAGTG